MKTALITGTSTGIGKATAIHLARHGYRVFATMRNPASRSDELLNLAHSQNLALSVLPLDIQDAKACEKTVNTIIANTKRLDVLINNAGVAKGGYLEEFSEDNLRDMFETNFFGTMRLMKLVIPHMRQNKQGTIVNISSIMGIISRAGGSGYSASKWALEAASESLAQEVRRFNIRVVLIEPGVVDTPLHHKGSDDQPIDSPYQQFNERGTRLFTTLLESPTMPEDVAKTVQHAIETDQPKLRYLVGVDAEKWSAGRQAMSDEDWVDVGRYMTLEEYVQFYKKQFKMMI